MLFKKLCVFLATMLFSFASAEQPVEQVCRRVVQFLYISYFLVKIDYVSPAHIICFCFSRNPARCCFGAPVIINAPPTLIFSHFVGVTTRSTTAHATMDITSHHMKTSVYRRLRSSHLSRSSHRPPNALPVPASRTVNSTVPAIKVSMIANARRAFTNLYMKTNVSNKNT